MSILINGVSYIDTEIQLCYLTIEYKGDKYEYCANTPILKDQSLQTLVDSRENGYVYSILKQIYPEAIFKSQENETQLQAIERWIADGAVNSEITEDYVVEVSKAVYAIPDSDLRGVDKRKKDRRVVMLPVENANRIRERRKHEEVTQAAVIETRTRVVRPRKVIEKKEWVSTHPKKLGLASKINSATTIKQLKEVLLEML